MIARFGSILGALLGRRPPELQVAAICSRKGRDGPEVLLLTSLDTGRWVIPKGWPMKGRSLAGAAQREAWEEAGATGPVDPAPIGSYRYAKRRGGGLESPVEVAVFHVTVRRMERGYPEEGKRELRWASPAEAAAMVDEPELSAIFRAFPAEIAIESQGSRS